MLGFFLFIFIGYHIFMSPAVLEPLIKKIFAESTTGSIDFTLKRASLFRGFSFENLEVRSGADFDNKPIFKAKKINLFWNVYGFWAGDIGVYEVGLYSPEFYLTSKGKAWNIERLMKTSDKKPEPKPKEKPQEKSSKFQFPFSVRLFAKMIIENFKVVVDGSASTPPLEAGVKNFTLRFHMLSERISQIPENPLVLLEKINTFVFRLNPHKPLDIYFRNPRAATKTPFDLHLLLALDTTQAKPKFKSRLKVGNSSIPVTFSGKQLLPLGLNIEYKMGYNPLRDLLSLDFFNINILNQKWVKLQGHIERATHPDKFFMNMQLSQSHINLTQLYPHYKRFTGKLFPKFAGQLSLAPISFTGPLNDLRVRGKLSLMNILVQLPKPRISIPQLILDYEAQFNFQKKDKTGPLVYAQANLAFALNKAPVKLNAFYEPQKKTKLSLRVTRFNPAPYINGQVRGFVNLNLDVSGRHYNNLDTTLKIYSPELYYTAAKRISGLNRLSVDLMGNIHLLDEKFSMIDVTLNKMAIFLKNQNNKDAIRLIATNKLAMRPNSLKNAFRLNDFSAHIRNLYPTLSDVLREKIEVARQNISGPISLTGGTDLHIVGKVIKVNHLTTLLVPNYGIDDVNIIAESTIRPGYIDIPKVNVTGFRGALELNAYGNLKEGIIEKVDPKDANKIIKAKGYHKNLHLDLKVAQNKMLPVYEDHSIKGKLQVIAALNDNIAKGTVSINDFYYNSKMASVNNIQFSFPFLHNLLLRKTLNLTAANKERIIKNYNFDDPYNFTIESMFMANPLRQSEKLKLLTPYGKNPGFGATIRYKDNVFEIPNMQLYTLNGLVSGKDIMFNVGRIKLSEMQYSLGLQLKEIDLKQLIPENQAKEITDGAISADIMFIGEKLNQPVENLNGYVAVYKIGNQFGKQALKVVKPDSGSMLDFAIDNSISVKKIDMNFKEGLVYAKVIYRKLLLGRLIGPAGDRILQERIPIPEFLQRAGNEAKVYQKGNAAIPKNEEQ